LAKWRTDFFLKEKPWANEKALTEEDKKVGVKGPIKA